MVEPVAFSEPMSTASNFNGVRLSSRIIPADRAAGGADWGESFVISRDVIALSIGDVCGHGPAKQAPMGALRGAIRDAAGRGLDPASVLGEANDFLRRLDSTESATAVFALLNTRDRTLTYANAGHPPPLMTGPFGAIFLEFPEADLPLGIEDRLRPTLRQINVPAATLFVFYTDGVSERNGRPLQGEGELRRAAIFAHHFADVDAAVAIEEQMLLSGSNRDDAAILTAWTPHAPIVRNAGARKRVRANRRAGDRGRSTPLSAEHREGNTLNFLVQCPCQHTLEYHGDTSGCQQCKCPRDRRTALEALIMTLQPQPWTTERAREVASNERSAHAGDRA